ncbi:MAG: redox-regulated ATPase YchF [Candidatus Porifericomitaceae bacterium WSBS_2022_MAG_OTU9]
MGFKCGIVGLPNVGKSTLFNAITSAGVDAENYPFCTVEPNTGVVEVPDPRLMKIAAIVKPDKTVYTQTAFVDIAGLVKGASRGEGLGNRFLAHIRETQAIVHVVRCFTEKDITHVSNTIDPIADIETVDTELCLADLEALQKTADKTKRMANSGDKEARKQDQILQQLIEKVNNNIPLRAQDLTEEQYEKAQELGLITIKPVLYAGNVDEHNAATGDNQWKQQLEDKAKQEQADIVFISAKIEAEIATLQEQEKQDFYQEIGITESGLDRLIKKGYKILDLQTFFTAGEKEAKAWTITKETTAQKAAGKIHTDIERGFIRAEVIGYQDYIENNGEQGAKQAGKHRLEGKEYIIQDGDIVHFRHNT